MSLLGVEEVVVRAGSKTLLDLPALDIGEGEILAVLGPTGAGKSTLLRVMSFLQRPERGTILWRGEPVSWPAPLATRRLMAMVFQAPLLFSGTVLENVGYGLRVRGERGETLRRRVDAALRLFHVDHLADRRAATLSGGEAQRTALARAWVVEPEILFLDEPLASLDAPIRDRILEELRQNIRDRKMTCVYVTHEQSEAFAIADRIAILAGGKLLQAGSPEEVFYRPEGRAVADFLRTENILSGEVVSREAGMAAVRISGQLLRAASDLEPGTKVLLCVRPEDVVLTRDPGSAPNRIEGTVTAILDQGPTLKVSLDCGLGLTARVTRRSARELDLRPGVRVGVVAIPSAVHLVPENE